jgi:hypothetical protein
VTQRFRHLSLAPIMRRAVERCVRKSKAAPQEHGLSSICSQHDRETAADFVPHVHANVFLRGLLGWVPHCRQGP